MRGIESGLYRPIDGTGQSVSLTSGTAASFANVVGTQTYAVAIAITPAATPYVAFVRVSKAGTAAAAGHDLPISSNNTQPVIVRVAPGETVSLYQASGSGQTGYMCDLSH